MHRSTRSALLVMIACAPALADDGCDNFRGNWFWFTGNIVTFTADHRITYGGKTVGHWECTDPAARSATLRWNSQFVDKVTLSGDQISGVNQVGYKVWANRSTPETAADMPKLTRPPAPAVTGSPQSNAAPQPGCQGAGNWRQQCQNELSHDPIAGPFPSQGAISNCVQQKMAACGNLVP